MLDADGGLPEAVGLDPDDRQEWQRRLDRDGLHLVIGRADATRREPGRLLAGAERTAVRSGPDPEARPLLCRAG